MEINTINAYTPSGVLIPSILFESLFKTHPSLLSITLKNNHKINLELITPEVINSVFPKKLDSWEASVEKNFLNKYSLIDSEDIDESEGIENSDDVDVFFDGEAWVGATITVIDEEAIVIFAADSLNLYYNSCHDRLWANEYCANILKQLPGKFEKPEASKVNLVGYDRGDYYTSKQNIKPTTIDIDKYYNDDFAKAYKSIEEFLNSRESGLVLLHGEKGTGKTNMIRHIITNIPKEYIIIPNGMMPHIANPEFISFISDHKDSIFILEDCEQILLDRGANPFNSGISTILNMSDGLLSDIFNIKFICTFNMDESLIDSALLRKGRCYVNYDFKPLVADKVKVLAEEHDIELKEVKAMTLAELFNADVDDFVPEVHKLGF